MNCKLLSFILLFGLSFMACNNDDDNDVEVCETSNITYTNTVADIFAGSCAVSGCHVDGNEMNALFSLEGYAKASAAASFGRMIGAMSHEEDFAAMPPSGNKLDQCTIDKVSAWIDAGTPE